MPQTQRNQVRRRNRPRRKNKKHASSTSGRFVIRVAIGKPFQVPMRNLTARLTYVSNTPNVTSNGGGIITLNASDACSGSGEWSSFAAIFDSYRIRSMAVEFIPNLVLQGSASYTMPMFIMVFDADSTSQLSTTNYSAYTGHDTYRIMSLNEHWTYEVLNYPRYSSAAAITGAYTIYENGFIDCSTVAGIGSIQGFATGASTSVNYGSYIIHWIVDFADRQ
jgi:hypothetical protein